MVRKGHHLNKNTACREKLRDTVKLYYIVIWTATKDYHIYLQYILNPSTNFLKNIRIYKDLSLL